MSLERISESDPLQGEERPNLRLATEPLSAEIQLKVLNLLASTLDLNALLQALPKAIQVVAPVDGLQYQAPHSSAALPVIGRKSRHSVNYRLLPSDQSSLGELTLFRNTAFRDQELARIEAVLPLIMLTLRNALAYRDAVVTAHRDALTGVGNRLALDTAGRHEVEVAQRHRLPMTLLMIDLDHFKAVNDTYGHAVGDEVLKLLGETLTRAVRRADTVFRYGGEEFVVLLPNTDLQGARIMAERIRILVVGNNRMRELVRSGVTVSVGVASLQGKENLEGLCERADTALYAAKRAGRNRIAAAD